MTHVKQADPATDKEEDSSPDETIEEYVFDVVQPSNGGLVWWPREEIWFSLIYWINFILTRNSDYQNQAYFYAKVLFETFIFTI